jgi:ATP-binding cassette subfamily B protein
MIAIMFYINWRFAVVALCVLPPLIIVTRISSRKMRRDWDKVKGEEASAVSVVNEVLSSVRLVKAFGQENNESKRFEMQADKAVKSQIKIARIAGFFSGLTGLIFAVGTAAFLYLGAKYVHTGQMTIGELTMMLAYLAQINTPLQSIIKITNDVQSSISSLSRVFTLLDMEKEVSEQPHSVHLSRVKGACRFEDVSFGYKQEHLTLQHVSFDVQPGDRVGIVGTTGAGKSTLISLLTRFYDVSSGSILMDGKDIKQYKLEDYRGQFGMVLQEPVLFSTTIAENIKYGKPGATEQEIIEAAKAANAHGFIMKCKDGYDTVVGERGALLSGGERQRISIARAFIKDAPILILDEPTSSVDVKTEGQIMDAMERLMKGRTTFMITHRLDTLKTCNVIIHLEGGRVVDFKRNADSRFLDEKRTAIIGA